MGGIIDSLFGGGGGGAAIKAAEIGAKSSKEAAEIRAATSKEAAEISAASSKEAAELQIAAAKDAAALQAASSKEAAEIFALSQKEASAAQLAGTMAGVGEQRRQFDSSLDQLAPFREAGIGALGQQQALLGLQGVEQQQLAFDSFSESPGQKFLRERGERALLRNASAIGGVGGGNIRSALNEQGIGVAAGQMSDFQNRLGEMSGTGQAATSLGAQLGSNAAANIQSGLQYGGNVTGAGILGAGQSMSSGAFNSGQAGAQGILSAGQAGAQGILGAGQSMSSGAFNSGQAGAQGILGAGQAGAQGVIGAQQARGAISQQLLGTGIGALAGSGALGTTAMGAFGGGAGSGALIGLLSDIRLKTNVIKTGELESGLSWYTWDWTDEGLEIAGNQLTEGVLAHEAQKKFPNAVHKINGVLRVNYERIH